MNADAFNAAYPVGTPVLAYPFIRPDDPIAVAFRERAATGRLFKGADTDPCTRLVTRTRSKAQVLGGHTDVVWVDGHDACIALTHIDIQPTPAAEPAAECRCGEPDADPYSCEADDCEGEFSELNPFGGGPVQGHDAKVSRTCWCGWQTSVWHVDDGSAEEELHRHAARIHTPNTTPEEGQS